MPNHPLPAQTSSTTLNIRWDIEYAPPQRLKWKHSLGGVWWRCEVRYSAIFGAPVLPVRAKCLMYTILSAPLHLYFGSYLPGWVTHLLLAWTHVSPLFGPIGQPRKRVQACVSITSACMCVCVQTYQYSLCASVAIVYINDMWGGGLPRWGREKGNAAPAKLHHSWCHAQAALCCSWRCLHSFLGLEL